MTNYTVFFLGELKHRLHYLLFSFFIISVYGAVYVNDIFIYILYPVNQLNVDLDLESFVNILSHSFLFNTTFDVDKINISYDYYPVFEINITNNTHLYKHIFLYCYTVFLLPVFFYQIYLFVLPGLFIYEYSKLIVIFFTFWFSLFTYLKYFHSIFLSWLLFFSYNNFYEYYNYEFDIEFDVNLFLISNNALIILFILNVLLYISIAYSSLESLKFFFFFINCYFFFKVTTFFFFFILLYSVLYLKNLILNLKR